MAIIYIYLNSHNTLLTTNIELRNASNSRTVVYLLVHEIVFLLFPQSEIFLTHHQKLDYYLSPS